MNLPNKLSMSRIALVPVFVFVYLTPVIKEPAQSYGALAIFAIASFTDFLDGYIARKYNLITNFGKFADTVADKILVCSALVCLLEKDLLPAWLLILILSREFIIMAFRTIAAAENIIIAASMMGKIKTNIQMALILFLLLNIKAVWAQYMSAALIWLAAAFTVVSAVEYIYKNFEVLKS